MRRARGGALVAIFGVLVLTPASGAFPLASQATFFTDAAGDSGAKPDLTEVSVGNDVVAGPIVVWVEIPNRTRLGPTDLVSLFVDSDRDGTTGAQDWAGSEYSVDVYGGAPMLWRWDGTQWMSVSAPSLIAGFAEASKALRISIHPNDLGGTRAFDFYLYSSTDGQAGDYAPNVDMNLWSYTISTAQLRLTAEEFATTPRVPRAGATFRATMLVGRDDIYEILSDGTVRCSLRVGTKSVAATSRRFVDGSGVCNWRLPKTARGKQLRMTITVSYGGATVSRTFNARVR